MKVKDDIVTTIGQPKKLLPMLHESKGTGFEGHEFFEASSIRKINGKYYLVYSSVTLHELCYAISDKPDEGYKYGGIECIDGHYYIFYHRQTNRTTFSSQGCAEPITFTEDGKICQAEMISSGLYGKPLPGYGTYPAACAAHLRGKKTPLLSDLMAMGMEHPYLTQNESDFDAGFLKVRSFLPRPTQYIANCQNGFHAMYRYFEMEARTRTISVRAHGDADGMLLIKNSEDGEILGRIYRKNYIHTGSGRDLFHI